MLEIDTPTRREIEKRTRMLLLDASFKAPPVSVDVLIESLRVFKGFYDLTDPGLCRKFAHAIHVGTRRIGQIAKKIDLRALLLQQENRIMIDLSLHELKKTWAAYHEVVHKILPWHKAFYIGDTAQTLEPYYQERLDLEANSGASDLMFCGKAFSKMALDTTPCWNSIELLCKECETSRPTTLLRYAEYSHDRPMAALISIPRWFETPEAQPNGWRHIVGSIQFRSRFSSITPEIILDAVNDNTYRRSWGLVGEYEIILPDNNNEFHLFNAQSFFNHYDILTLIVSE